MNGFNPRTFPVSRGVDEADAKRQAAIERQLVDHRLANLEEGHELMADQLQALIIKIANLEASRVST